MILGRDFLLAVADMIIIYSTKFAFTIDKLYDSETNEAINTINPGKTGQTVKMIIPYGVKKGWILRHKKA